MRAFLAKTKRPLNISHRTANIMILSSLQTPKRRTWHTFRFASRPTYELLLGYDFDSITTHLCAYYTFHENKSSINLCNGPQIQKKRIEVALMCWRPILNRSFYQRISIINHNDCIGWGMANGKSTTEGTEEWLIDKYGCLIWVGENPSMWYANKTVTNSIFNSEVVD